MRNIKERRDGTGSYFQTSQGWVAQVRYLDHFTGKSKQIRRRARSRDQARALLKELMAESPKPKNPDARITVAEWLDRWAEKSLPVSALKPKTQELYRHLIANPLKPSLGKIALVDFTPSEAEAWLQRLAKTPKVHSGPEGHSAPVSAGTQRNAFNCLKRSLDAAVRDGLITVNPLTQVSRPVVPRAQVPVTSPEAVDTVILPAVADMRIGPLVTFVALTGCRVGEASGLRWQDVDLASATATIRRSSPMADSTKTDRARTVPLLPEVVESLKTARKRQREDRLLMGEGWQDSQGLVFTTGTGSPIDLHNARRDLARVLKRNGLPTSRPFHSLRHGLASRLLARDVAIPLVSAILGHSSIRVTADVYGHVQPALHADALAKAMGR